MARDATARLYDVDEELLVFKKLRLSKKYDQGTITFRAKKGKLVDLEKLHESIWATRLSGGTSSGVICLDVTAVGEVAVSEDETTLKVTDTNRQFVLVDNVNARLNDGKKSSFKAMRDAIARGGSVVSVTGYVDGWVGRWPRVLSKPLPKKQRIMVTSFQLAGDRDK